MAKDNCRAINWRGIISDLMSARDKLGLRHGKREMVSVIGRLEVPSWGDGDEIREQWQEVFESLVSARIVHPGGKRKRGTWPPSTRPACGPRPLLS
jgi:hypothetical protein